MKTLTNFLISNPSYCKCSNERIAKRTGLKESTVKRFKKTLIFSSINNNYRNSR